DAGNVLTIPVSGLKPATTYYARVKAYDAATNSSAVSATASATTTDTSAPTAPTNVAISAITSSGFTLSWAASTDDVAVTGYRIDVATTADFSALLDAHPI